jgi:DNA-binding MarR family transcriptional regulator
MSDSSNIELTKNKSSSALSETFNLIYKINKKVRDLHRELVREYKVTIPQYCVLRHLGNSGGLQLKELASGCHISPPTMTGVVDTLEEKKLVMRVKNEDDRRSLLVVLTKAGKQLYDSLPMQQNMFKNCCAALSSNEILTMNKLLKKLEKHFGKVD